MSTFQFKNHGKWKKRNKEGKCFLVARKHNGLIFKINRHKCQHRGGPRHFLHACFCRLTGLSQPQQTVPGTWSRQDTKLSWLSFQTQHWAGCIWCRWHRREAGRSTWCAQQQRALRHLAQGLITVPLQNCLPMTPHRDPRPWTTQVQSSTLLEHLTFDLGLNCMH